MPAPKFIADGNLGRLAKRLRMLGFDCYYDGGASLADIIAAAVADGRILITDRTIAATLRLNVHRIPANSRESHLKGILDAYHLGEHLNPFSRCLVCNGRLARVDDKDGVPESVIERGLDIYLCPGCGRKFWHGSHVERMRSSLEGEGLTV